MSSTFITWPVSERVMMSESHAPSSHSFVSRACPRVSGMSLGNRQHSVRDVRGGLTCQPCIRSVPLHVTIFYLQFINKLCIICPIKLMSNNPSFQVSPRRCTRMRQRQLELQFRTWGGANRGAGRRPRGTRGNVSHRARPEHDERQPVHVTLRAARRLPSLRKQTIFLQLRRALARTSREWFRVV